MSFILLLVLVYAGNTMLELITVAHIHARTQSPAVVI